MISLSDIGKSTYCTEAFYSLAYLKGYSDKEIKQYIRGLKE